MPGSYTADEQSAAKIAAGIADDPDELKVGIVVLSTTSGTVTHSFTAAPDFILATAEKSFGVKGTANTTSLTFTVATSATSNTVSYIAGYTA